MTRPQKILGVIVGGREIEVPCLGAAVAGLVTNVSKETGKRELFLMQELGGAGLYTQMSEQDALDLILGLNSALVELRKDN